MYKLTGGVYMGMGVWKLIDGIRISHELRERVEGRREMTVYGGV